MMKGDIEILLNCSTIPIIITQQHFYTLLRDGVQFFIKHAHQWEQVPRHDHH